MKLFQNVDFALKFSKYLFLSFQILNIIWYVDLVYDLHLNFVYDFLYDLTFKFSLWFTFKFGLWITFKFDIWLNNLKKLLRYTMYTIHIALKYLHWNYNIVTIYIKKCVLNLLVTKRSNVCVASVFNLK